jgi:hypothetical protein
MWQEKSEDATSETANLVTSVAWRSNQGTPIHYPLIDIDMDAALLPSSTKGHHHLYIKQGMSWEAYEKLLVALVEAGIVQYGVLNNARKNKYTSLRMPHVKKGSPEDHPFKEEPPVATQTQLDMSLGQLAALQMQVHNLQNPQSPF